MKVLHLDKNHPILLKELEKAGFTNHEDYASDSNQIQSIIKDYDGIVVRSRLPIDKELLSHASKLKFIGRVGAGMENIDINYAQSKNIQLFNAPEGNRDAVAEHAMAMLLMLTNRIKIANQQVQKGIWLREENRGEELLGKTVGLIGYGNTGKAFAKRLSSFGVRVIFVDVLADLTDDYATQVTINELFKLSDVLSLHLPLTAETNQIINRDFLQQFSKPIYFLNTARGKCVNTSDLVWAIKNKLVKGAGLDVLEYEKSSFEQILNNNQNPDFEFLTNSNHVVITPHIAGWTHQSKVKLAKVIANKIIAAFA